MRNNTHDVAINWSCARGYCLGLMYCSDKRAQCNFEIIKNTTFKKVGKHSRVGAGGLILCNGQEGHK
jgi:hypothetical protein